MREAYIIKAEDLRGLQIDENGNYIIPDGIKIFIEEKPEEKIQLLRSKIEQMESVPEPTDQELMDLGKTIHPYYMERIQLETLKLELNSLL